MFSAKNRGGAEADLSFVKNCKLARGNTRIGTSKAHHVAGFARSAELAIVDVLAVAQLDLQRPGAGRLADPVRRPHRYSRRLACGNSSAWET